jgi:hypothetical protein
MPHRHTQSDVGIGGIIATAVNAAHLRASPDVDLSPFDEHQRQQSQRGVLTLLFVVPGRLKHCALPPIVLLLFSSFSIRVLVVPPFTIVPTVLLVVCAIFIEPTRVERGPVLVIVIERVGIVLMPPIGIAPLVLVVVGSHCVWVGPSAQFSLFNSCHSYGWFAKYSCREGNRERQLAS